MSIASDRKDLLTRGMGWEHLRDLLLCLARSMLRGANLAYGGNWKKNDENFLFSLLELIRAEQENSDLSGQKDYSSVRHRPGTSRQVGKLYNYLAWPSYLGVTPNDEARWISCCRIIRVEQSACLPANEIVSDSEARNEEPQSLLNEAVTLSEMRNRMMKGISNGTPETVPGASACILLGGEFESYSGFLPGVLEEAIVALNLKRPVYILGGFGGAAERLADAILAGSDCLEVLTRGWHKKQNPKLMKLLDHMGCVDRTHSMLNEISRVVQLARDDLSGTLNTGLSNKETGELLRTQNITNAVQLVCKGLSSKMNERRDSAD